MPYTIGGVSVMTNIPLIASSIFDELLLIGNLTNSSNMPKARDNIKLHPMYIEVKLAKFRFIKVQLLITLLGI